MEWRGTAMGVETGGTTGPSLEREGGSQEVAAATGRS